MPGVPARPGASSARRSPAALPHRKTILALIGRAVAERDHLQSVRPVELILGEIARIDRLQALARGKRDRTRLDGDEQPVDRRRGFGRRGFGGRVGGASDGHRNARSRRSCAPEWRCAEARIAPGGTLNSTPPTVTGRAGASGATAAPGQRGHSTSATNAAPPRSARPALRARTGARRSGRVFLRFSRDVLRWSVMK